MKWDRIIGLLVVLVHISALPVLAMNLTLKAPSDVEAGKAFHVEIVPLDLRGEVVEVYTGKIMLSVGDQVVEQEVALNQVFAKNEETDQVVLEFMKGTIEITVAQPGWYRIEITDGRTTAYQPIRCHKKMPEERLYWGELHTHSSYCGDAVKAAFQPYKSYVWGRDVGCLDFGTIVSHHWSLDARKWARLAKVQSMFNKPGEFVSIVGYEWGQGYNSQARWNHNNVYFLADAGPLCKNRATVEDLWAFLDDESTVPTMAIPHHPATKAIRYTWDDSASYNPKYQSIVEIHSIHGNSECKDALHQGACTWEDGYVQNALANGYILGFIAGSDNHGGRLGTNSDIGSRRKDIPIGMAAVYAGELTRKGIWDGLVNRHCYGTSGAQRIIVDFRVNDRHMGEVVSTSSRSPRKILVEVGGTDKIDTIEIIKNNRVIHTVRGKGWHEKVDFVDNEPGAGHDYYYVRVTQADKNLAWVSPIWIGPDL